MRGSSVMAARVRVSLSSSSLFCIACCTRPKAAGSSATFLPSSISLCSTSSVWKRDFRILPGSPPMTTLVSRSLRRTSASLSSVSLSSSPCALPILALRRAVKLFLKSSRLFFAVSSCVAMASYAVVPGTSVSVSFVSARTKRCCFL